MATQFDTSPEVVHNPSDHLPQVYDAGNSPHSGYPYASYTSPSSDVPPPFERNDSQIRTPPLSDKEAGQAPPPASAAVSEREKKSRICGCPVIVFILITALAVAVAAVIGLAAATGVAMKKSNDSDTKLNALRESYAAFSASASDAVAATAATVTVTSTAPASTDVDLEELTSGCSNKKDTTTGTVYTSKFMKKFQFTLYCNTNAPNDPIFSVFATNLNGCVEACNAWNSYNTTEKTCEGVSFVPFWARIGNAATNNAPGDCYLKPGPQDRDGLEDAEGTHAALLKN
ncbi:hypothetical protein CEP52_005715 [Fusarium oligoseptatum]|uniref:Apple domain-containing protein n=2 Tax=Fusarium solani species complex TaxID=232080 RepID=A0A428TWY2_9HYPO|nr:hypothetical protein CEP52_005715 [Fusarium oligoseptatum]RSM20237.1 hypothetical protein CDV31_001034 [Fusarium ambrosium]